MFHDVAKDEEGKQSTSLSLVHCCGLVQQQSPICSEEMTAMHHPFPSSLCLILKTNPIWNDRG